MVDTVDCPWIHKKNSAAKGLNLYSGFSDTSRNQRFWININVSITWMQGIQIK